jgi:murein DD-endopeptidase MepM/ murein hydrolase activator NlpD
VKFLNRLFLTVVLAGVLSSGTLAAEDLIHVVGRGDTIYSISRFYRVTAEELMRVNGISDPSRLQVGRRLTIPSSAFSDINVTPATGTPQVSASQATAAVQSSDYRVVRGDTLFSIARTHGISLQNLLEMNRFSSNHVIRVGDVIKVPARNTTAAATTPAQATGAAAVQNSGSTGNNAASSGAGTPVANPGILSLLWPIHAKEINYMTGQMGVVVEGEHSESVKSITGGRVISAGPWRKFGKVAIVEASGGYLYMYGGCETLSVNVGDRISVGTELGKLGINAVSEKPHLFFMVFRSDTPIDPARAPRAAGNNKT